MQMKRAFLVCVCAVGLGCHSEDSVPKKAVVGGTALDAKSVVEHSVIIVAGEQIQAVGTMANTPVPATAEKVEGRDRFIVPAFVREPPDFPSEPVTTYDEFMKRVASGDRVVYGMVQDREVEDPRWFTSVRQSEVRIVPRLSRLKPDSEEFRIAAANTKKLADALAHIVVLAPKLVPAEIFDEFATLEKIGLTPDQILAAATLEAALALEDGDSGLLLPQKRASLLVLGGDPRKKLSNFRLIERVMVNGTWGDASRPFAN